MGVRVDINSEFFSFAENYFPPPSLKEQEERRTRCVCPVPAGFPALRSSCTRKLGDAGPSPEHHDVTPGKQTAQGQQLQTRHVKNKNTMIHQPKLVGGCPVSRKWSGMHSHPCARSYLFLISHPSKQRIWRAPNEIRSWVKCYPLRGLCSVLSWPLRGRAEKPCIQFLPSLQELIKIPSVQKQRKDFCHKEVWRHDLVRKIKPGCEVQTLAQPLPARSVLFKTRFPYRLWYIYIYIS